LTKVKLHYMIDMHDMNIMLMFILTILCENESTKTPWRVSESWLTFYFV